MITALFTMWRSLPERNEHQKPTPAIRDSLPRGRADAKCGAEPFGRLLSTTVALKNARNYP